MKERKIGEERNHNNDKPINQKINLQKEQSRLADPKEALKVFQEYAATITPEQYFEDVRRFSGSGKCFLDYLKNEEEKSNEKTKPSKK